MAALTVLQTLGPNLGRPLVDTINASQFTHMKELRIQHKGKPIRALFAFDPLRQAIVLCIGNKGGNEKLFYKKMIPIADELEMSQQELARQLGITQPSLTIN